MHLISPTLRFCFVVSVIATSLLLSPAALADGPVSDQVIAELRLNTYALKNAWGYKISIASGQSTVDLASPSYTAGWIGIETQPRLPSGQCPAVYACEFSQVGFYLTQFGLTWFVYAEPGVHCYRGQPAWVSDKTRGCIGAIGDIVQEDTWHSFDLETYSDKPYWLAHVYSKYKVFYYVAKILTTSKTAYRVYAFSEQTWDKELYPWDPYQKLDYQFYRPQRKKYGTFRDWPKSRKGHNNFLWTFSTDNHQICPPEGLFGGFDYNTTPPAWFAGRHDNGQCSINPLF